MVTRKKKKRWSSSQIIMAGFGALILTGAFLLMLPVSSASGQWTPFIDALFTSTSASCVTGLIVQDTATYWSAFGQTVIICLIQIGGMGVVTMAIAIAMASGRKISLSQRRLMQDSISARQVGGIVKMTGFIIRTSIMIELAGAALLSLKFIPEFGFFKGILFSVFHSISAFCNAGFDLMGVKTKYSSLMDYSGDAVVSVTIVFLIIIGGIGFAVWEDIKLHRADFRRYRLQSKVALTATAVLIVAPFIYFFFVEFSRQPWQGMELKERILASLFRAVTPRTAGFNTVDMTLFSESTMLITIVLMLIGGCPGSTAGGMKTTTIAVLLITMLSVFRRESSPDCFGRRISDDTIKNAATILMMYVTLFIAGAVTISIVEDLPLIACMFETASAVATVGLTLGITPALGAVSKLILTGLMFLGRVGGLTIIFATVKGVQNGSARYPLERITVG